MRHRLISRVLPVVAALSAVGLLSGGMSTDGPAASSGASCVDLSGDWDCGSWRSATSGHSGKLRAKLTRCGANRYQCVFRGTFFGFIPFRYPVTLHVTGCEGGRVYFRASRTMPLCGGTFSCRGSATRCSFRADFSSQDDRGVFTVSR